MSSFHLYFIQIGFQNRQIFVGSYQYMRSLQGDEQNIADSILESEIEFLNLKGPTLGMFSNPRNKTIPFVWEPISVKNPHGSITIPKDGNSNVRALYYCLLHSLFDYEQTQLSKRTLQRLKQLVYSTAVRLDEFKPREVDSRYREFYDNRLFKKIFVEFLQVLSFQRCQGATLRMLGEYHIMDLILILITRAIYNSSEDLHHGRQHSLNEIIPTQNLINCFERKLELLIPTCLSKSNIFSFGGVSYYEGQNSCTLVEIDSEKTPSMLAQHPSTCQSVELSQIQSSVSDFSEVIINDFGIEAAGETTPHFRHLNALYSEKFRRLREHNQTSNHTASHQIFSLDECTKKEDFKCQTPIRQHFFVTDQHPKNSNQTSSSTPKLDLLVKKQSQNKSHNVIVPPLKLQKKESSEIEQHRQKIQQIYDGLTSPQVMNLLKPQISRQMNEKRKQSVMKLINDHSQSRFNTTSRTNTTIVSQNNISNRNINECNTRVAINQTVSPVRHYQQQQPNLLSTNWKGNNPVQPKFQHPQLRVTIGLCQNRPKLQNFGQPSLTQRRQISPLQNVYNANESKSPYGRAQMRYTNLHTTSPNRILNNPQSSVPNVSPMRVYTSPIQNAINFSPNQRGRVTGTVHPFNQKLH